MQDDSYLRGQVRALLAAVLALVETHPHKRELQESMKASLEATIGNSLCSPTLSESYLDGLDDIADRLLLHVNSAAEADAEARGA